METSALDESRDPFSPPQRCQVTTDFQNALKDSVERILNRVTDDVFINVYKKCYQSLDKKDDVQKPPLGGSSTEARKYRKQFNALVSETILDGIEETFTQEMDKKLNELEEMKKEQSDKSFVWRPPGNAHEHMMPFNIVSKMEEKKILENKIRKERDTINLLQARLVQKRLKAHELNECLSAALKMIEKSVVVPKSDTLLNE